MLNIEDDGAVEEPSTGEQVDAIIAKSRQMGQSITPPPKPNRAQRRANAKTLPRDKRLAYFHGKRGG